MKKSLLSLAILGVAATGAQAEMLQPSQALARALDSAPAKMRAADSGSAAKLAYTASDQVGQPAVYVFNTAAGYCVVAADDVAFPLLGYADSEFDPAAMPPALKYWIGEYARQIDWARENGAKAPQLSQWQDFEPIAPIMTTTWNQSAPYNNMCPICPNGNRAITGCVATAMAQVMKAHNWPPKGTGSKSYSCDGVGKMLTMRFANTEFDWEHMLDRYTNDATQEETDAVALLMKACGYSVEMGYTEGACGAYSRNVAIALPQYFSYDKGIQYLNRDFFDMREWQSMIYNELVAGRPVYYSGSNDEAGHAFVLDGYSSNGYFHVNWGWNGQSDGYFLVNGLDPAEQGLGGSSAGYNNWQEAILNVKPAVEGVESAPHLWLAMFGLETDKSEYSLGEMITYTTPAYNYSINKISTKAALQLSAEGIDPIVIVGEDFTTPANTGQYPRITLPADLQDGVYTASVGFINLDGEFEANRVIMYAPHTSTFTVKDGKATIAHNPVIRAKYEQPTFSPIFVNNKVLAKATAVNTWDHDFYYQVKVSVQDATGKEVLATPYTRVDVPAGEEQEFTYMQTLSLVNGATIDYNAKYYAFITDDTNHNVSDPVEVTINEEETPVFSGTLAVAEGINANAMDNNALDFTVDLNVESGLVADTPTMWFYNSLGDAYGSLRGELLLLGKGENASIHISGANSRLANRGRYKTQVWWGGKWATNYIWIKIDTTSGITTVSTEEAPVKVEYFNLQGVAVAQPKDGGVYVVRYTFADGSQETETVIK